MEQEKMDYNRVAQAIDYIRQHFKEQPSLEAIAQNSYLSPFHFQRLFSKWAGTSPKKFLQYISAEHAKKVLRESGASLFDVAYETGLSGTSRLHDLFISIEGMTPAEYKHGGKIFPFITVLPKALLEISSWHPRIKGYAIWPFRMMRKKHCWN